MADSDRAIHRSFGFAWDSSVGNELRKPDPSIGPLDNRQYAPSRHSAPKPGLVLVGDMYPRRSDESRPGLTHLEVGIDD
jgi:hypothetical protein